MAKVSVVVSVYFNEQSLAPLFSEMIVLEQRLKEIGHSLELIFVDDGSGDDSLQELLKIKRQRESTRVVKLTRNFGAIHATKVGFGLVTGDCFMVLAADLQDPPLLILDMVAKWEAGSKYIICVRTVRNDPVWSRLFAGIYYVLLRLFVLKDYPRGGFDLALMDRTLLPYLQTCSKNIYTPLYHYWLGFKPEIIYYTRRKRLYGKSRWTFVKKVKAFLDAILGFSIVPLRAISVVGFVVSLLSFGYGVLIIVNTLYGHTEVRGFAAIVTLIAFLVGMVIIMLGIIGEYLWRIFDETNKRPEAVIDEIL
ncbi:MAG TPA: glycosyltransferase family 2 protein [Chthoniobacterales bacterium]|jgi:dolichol-phosphate mannosyltransferase|nr:glycosyltransferase family 2 protein [Chthoniobacterales bacterium]